MELSLGAKRLLYEASIRHNPHDKLQAQTAADRLVRMRQASFWLYRIKTGDQVRLTIHFLYLPRPDLYWDADKYTWQQVRDLHLLNCTSAVRHMCEIRYEIFNKNGIEHTLYLKDLALPYV